MILHLDYETRSKVDLPSVGAHRYACDPSTEVLMAGYSIDDSDDVKLWINPKFGVGEGVLTTFSGAGWDYIPDGNKPMVRGADQVWAHNSGFEQAVTWGCGKPHDIQIEISAWRCTAAMARKAGLPSSLEKCAEALGLSQQKDSRGKKLIKFFSILKEDGTFNEPRDFPEEFKAFGEYCKQDVRTEKAIHKKLKAFELTGFALETFQFDLRMNQRGIPVNVPALRNAQRIIDTVQKEVSEEFVKLTRLNPTQNKKVKELLNTLGLELENMQAATLEEVSESLDGMPNTEQCPHIQSRDAKAQRIVTLYRLLSYAAIKKVQTMLNWACPDGRMRGVLKYYGAGTGRWSAGGPQIQNAKKPTRAMRPITHQAFAAIEKGWSAEDISLIYGEPIEVIASSVRHFVGAADNLDGDYNAIEGRIACWIAGQHDILKDWADDKDLYIRAAAFVYNVPESSIPKKSELRDFGKVVELACQFGLGEGGFIRSCAKYGIECDVAKAVRAIRDYYRPTHRKVVERWYLHGQWMLDAIETLGVKAGPWIVRQIAGMKYLLLTLPSGRQLAYPQPEMNIRPPTMEERKEMLGGKKYHPNRFKEITFFGQFPNSQKWGRIILHGSLAFQNEVQAIAADVMAHGAIEAEKRGMPIYALIHDQGLAERLNGKTAEDFSAALATLPPWAKGLPLKVESKICKYYSK